MPFFLERKDKRIQWNLSLIDGIGGKCEIRSNISLKNREYHEIQKCVNLLDLTNESTWHITTNYQAAELVFQPWLRRLLFQLTSSSNLSIVRIF
jgi:hypothetical protein